MNNFLLSVYWSEGGGEGQLELNRLTQIPSLVYPICPWPAASVVAALLQLSTAYCDVLNETCGREFLCISEELRRLDWIKLLVPDLTCQKWVDGVEPIVHLFVEERLQ